MRLLKRAPDGSICLTSFRDDQVPRYAILSHTWSEGHEVTYQDLKDGAVNDETGREKTGYEKIRFCIDQAAADGLEYCWVDTCCIDKATSDELNTAINSMFRWYQRAAKCYVYLPDVEVPEEVSDPAAYPISWTEAFRNSRWFTRGWTLQELLAPASVEFFSKERKRLGSKISLEQILLEVTKLPIEALRQTRAFKDFSVEERFRWAAARQTTVQEDKAYCLLGIFEIFLPLIYGEGEDHAMQRVRDEVARRQQGAATSLSQDLAVPRRLPFPRNDFFTGRVEQLGALDEWLLTVGGQRHLAIHGLGGCGKSALAIEFAYRTMAVDAGRLVFWVPAISHQTFELAYREIGNILKVPGIDHNDADVKSLVHKALSTDRHKWLIIVDNADDKEILMEQAEGDASTLRLYDYLPRSDCGKILFTTRTRKVAESVAPRNVLQIQDPGRVEARQILEQRISDQALLEDEGAVQELLDELACLPLAIVQAAAFINENDVSISDYVSMLQETGTDAELFGEEFEDPSRYQEMESTIAKTWYISFEQIRRQDSLAGEYLSFMACTDRSNIPLQLLPEAESRVKQAKAIGTLKAYAFITERQKTGKEVTDDRIFDMHRLIHLASRRWLIGREEWADRLLEATVRFEEKFVQLWESRSFASSMQYVPHSLHVTSETTLNPSVRAALLETVGYFQFRCGQYTAAVGCLRDSLRLTETTFGTGAIRRLQVTRILAEILMDRDPNSDEAEALLRSALETCTKSLGHKNPETLLETVALGQSLHGQGRNEEAVALLRPALVTREEASTAVYSTGDWLSVYDLLARVLLSMRLFGEAEALQRHAWNEARIIYEDTDLRLCVQMRGLAETLSSLGKHNEAEDLARRAWLQTEVAVGPNCSDTRMSMATLSIVLSRQGRYEEALALEREILQRREVTNGGGQTLLVDFVSRVALLAEKCGLPKEAEQLYKRAWQGWKACLGEDYDETRRAEQLYLELHTRTAARTQESLDELGEK